MVFQQINQPIQNFHRGLLSGPSKMADDETVRRIETDNFNLRRQIEEKIRAINVLKGTFSKIQEDLDEATAKNKALETKSIAQKEEIKRVQSLFVNACKKRDPHALNKKVLEINGRLQATEEQLNSLKSENQKLKRKLSDDQTEYEQNMKIKRLKLAEKCSKIYHLKNDLKNEQEKFIEKSNELASVCETLRTTTEKLTELEGNRDYQIGLIKTQNECIRDLKSQASLLQPAVEENQRLRQSLEEAQKNTKDLEQSIEICKSKTKKLQSHIYRLSAKLKQNQTKLDGNLVERNHLFKFAQDVSILMHFPLNNGISLQNQLPEILAHLKETLQVGGCILQYQQQQNQQPSSSPPHIPSTSSSLQQPLNDEDEGDHDQLYDEFTSNSMMNIQFPLPSSSPQPSTNNFDGRTVQAVSTLPQPSTKVEITANPGNSQDSLFTEIMTDLHKSVKSKPKKNTKKAKAKNDPRSPRSKQNVISQTKKHEEDLSKRKKGGGGNCEGGSRYVCVCGTVETSFGRLNIHIEQRNQERKFQCNNCPKRFKLFGHLRQHLSRTHHMPHALDKYVTGCRSCGLMFETREQHRQHKISAHM